MIQPIITAVTRPNVDQVPSVRLYLATTIKTMAVGLGRHASKPIVLLDECTRQGPLLSRESSRSLDKFLRAADGRIEVSRRSDLGNGRSFLEALRHVLAVRADWYLVSEDDVEYPQGLGDWLVTQLEQATPVAPDHAGRVWSLYRPLRYSGDPVPRSLPDGRMGHWAEVPKGSHNSAYVGALSYLMGRREAKIVVEFLDEYLSPENIPTTNATDTAMGCCVEARRLEFWIPRVASVVQHLGEESSLWPWADQVPLEYRTGGPRWGIPRDFGKDLCE